MRLKRSKKKKTYVVATSLFFAMQCNEIEYFFAECREKKKESIGCKSNKQVWLIVVVGCSSSLEPLCRGQLHLCKIISECGSDVCVFFFLYFGDFSLQWTCVLHSFNNNPGNRCYSLEVNFSSSWSLRIITHTLRI